VTAALIIGVLGAIVLSVLALLALRTARGRALARMWSKACYRVIVGKPVTIDPVRGWKGTAHGDRAELRVMHVGDCSLRAMETSHDFYAPVGYPKVIAERLLDQRLGMEFGHYFTIIYEDFPEIERLKKVTKLSDVPNLILVHTGATYQRRVILKSTERINQVRLEVGRRLGRRIFTAHRLFVRPFVRRCGRHWTPYEGTAKLDSFIDQLQKEWPKATVAVVAPFPLDWAYPTSADIHAKVIAEARELAERRGLPFFEFDHVLTAHDLYCANGYNLNARGSKIVGDVLANWILDTLVEADSAPAPAHADDAHWRRHSTWQSGVRSTS